MKPLIIAITGPSGFRKSDLIHLALESSDLFVRAKAYTDRPIKENEIENDELHFISESEFTKMVESEKFLEWQRLLNDNYRYGKTRDEFEETIANNSDKIILSIINIINLPVFKRMYPKSKSIFIDVKDTSTLIEYLKASPDVKSEEEFERRFKFATEERRRRHLTDFTMHMLDDKDESLKNFLAIIEKCSDS